MSIILVLGLLGSGALITLRNQYIVDGIIEESISTLREAQNKSISVEGAYKGWAMWTVIGSESTPYYIVLGKIDEDKAEIERSTPLIRGATITPQNSSRMIAFMSPFGSPYITEKVTASQGCTWQVSSKPTKEFFPNSGCGSGTEIILKVEYKGVIKYLKINSAGDTRVTDVN